MKEIILNDETYFNSLEETINQAEKSIDLEVYIFDDDEMGLRIAKSLCEAARRGVKVRVMVDGVGSLNWGGTAAKQLKEAGIATRVYHPLPWKFWHWSSSRNLPPFLLNKIFYLLANINSRNHRKVCIIDNNIIYIGSANITAKPWRDTTIKICNVNPENLKLAYKLAWHHFFYEKILKNLFRKQPVDSIFQLNYTWRLRKKYHKEFIEKIKRSKKRIWLTNSYFVPDRKIIKALIKASDREIDVRILLSGESDIFFMPMITATFYEKLLKHNVKLYEYRLTMMHAKITIIDDWYTIGSSNLNHRSIFHDLEVNAILSLEETKNKVNDLYLKDLENAEQIDLSEFQKRPFYKKVLGSIFFLIKRWC